MEKRLGLLFEYIRRGHYSHNDMKEASEILHDLGVIDNERFNGFIEDIKFIKKIDDFIVPVSIIAIVMLAYGLTETHIIAIILSLILVYAFYRFKIDTKLKIEQELLPIIEVSLYDKIHNESKKEVMKKKLDILINYMKEEHYSYSNMEEASEILHNLGVINDERLGAFMKDIKFIKRTDDFIAPVLFLCLVILAFGFTSVKILPVITSVLLFYVFYKMKSDAMRHLRDKIINFYDLKKSKIKTTS